MKPMYRVRRTALAAFAIAAALVVAWPLANAAGPFPEPGKPIRFVVPYLPDGPTDLMARILQPELQKRLGVPVLEENRAGAGGNVGTDMVAKSARHGQTLLLAASGPMAGNGGLCKALPCNPVKDLAPVIQISALPLVLELHPGFPAKTLPDVPTLAELGMTGFDFTARHGIAVAGGTPKPIVQKVNGALNAIFADPDLKKRWLALGTQVVAGTAEQFGSLVVTETVRLGRVVRESGAVAE